MSKLWAKCWILVAVAVLSLSAVAAAPARQEDPCASFTDGQPTLPDDPGLYEQCQQLFEPSKSSDDPWPVVAIGGAIALLLFVLVPVMVFVVTPVRALLDHRRDRRERPWLYTKSEASASPSVASARTQTDASSDDTEAWRALPRPHRTATNTMVRSKSEVIVANTFTSLGLDYEYERRLYGVTGGFVVPDFTLPWHGKTWYWEHLGLMNDADYRTRWEKKRHWYEANGYGDSLIVSRDSADGAIDSSEIEQLIRTRILGGDEP